MYCLLIRSAGAKLVFIISETGGPKLCICTYFYPDVVWLQAMRAKYMYQLVLICYLFFLLGDLLSEDL